MPLRPDMNPAVRASRARFLPADENRGKSLASPYKINKSYGMSRYFTLTGALLMSSLPSLMACEGCKEPSNVAGDSGVSGISASFSWSVLFMITMVGFLLAGMILMMVRSCRQLASQHQQVSEGSSFASSAKIARYSPPPATASDPSGSTATALT